MNVVWPNKIIAMSFKFKFFIMLFLSFCMKIEKGEDHNSFECISVLNKNEGYNSEDIKISDYYFSLVEKIESRIKKSDSLFHKLNISSNIEKGPLKFKDIHASEEQSEYIFYPIKNDTNIINCIISLETNNYWYELTYKGDVKVKDIGNDIKYFSDSENDLKEITNDCFFHKRSLGDLKIDGVNFNNIFKVTYKLCGNFGVTFSIVLYGKKPKNLDFLKISKKI